MSFKSESPMQFVAFRQGETLCWRQKPSERQGKKWVCLFVLGAVKCNLIISMNQEKFGVRGFEPCPLLPKPGDSGSRIEYWNQGVGALRSAFGQLVIKAGCLCIVDRPVGRSGMSLKAPIGSGRRSIAVDVCEERSRVDRRERTLGGTGLPFSFTCARGRRRTCKSSSV